MSKEKPNRLCSICEEYFFIEPDEDEYEDMCPECRKEFEDTEVDEEDEEDDNESY